MSADATPARPSREPWAFAAACLAAAVVFQGTRGLWETDEGRYAQCALEMLGSGDFLRPTLQGLPHVTKPPGTYALTAVGILVLGANAWGARILVGLAFALSAWCVRRIGRGLLGDAAGRRAGWCYLTMLYPAAAGNVLTTDTFLVALVLGSIASSVASLRSARPAAWHLVAGLCLGGAMLVKGHIALLPWAAFVAGWAWGGRLVAPGRAVVSVAGVAVALTLGFSWYVWYAAVTPGAVDRFLGHEIAGRIVSTGDHSRQPLWLYPGILLAGSLPWWAPILRGGRRLNAGAPTVGGAIRRAAERIGGTGAGRVLAAWGGLTLLVFVLSPAKMPMYLLPVAAPLALWAGAGARDEGSPLPARPAVLAALLAALVGLKGVASLVPNAKDMLVLSRAVEAADPTGRLPVRVLSGRDVHGLEFYLADRDFRRVEAIEVRTDCNPVRLGAEAERLATARQPWILVAEGGERAQTAIARVLGEAAEPAGEEGGFRILRIVPKPR